MNDENEYDPHRDDCDTANQYSTSLCATQSIVRCQAVHLTSSPLLRILIMIRTTCLCKLDGGHVAGLERAGLGREEVVACAWSVNTG